MTLEHASKCTNGELNSLIARACGWSVDEHGWWAHPTLPRNGGAEPDAPDYAGSLDAMATAEATLDGFKADLTADFLVQLLNPSRIDGYNPKRDGAPTLSWPGLVTVLRAKARQRAIAFVATMEEEG